MTKLTAVGPWVWVGYNDNDGCTEGKSDGDNDNDGCSEGKSDGDNDNDGCSEGKLDGDRDGILVGERVGE